MFTRRNAILLCLGVGASVALAWQWNGDYLARLRAHHVESTIIVSPANRRLAGFFDGLQPDPHWNAKKATQTAQRIHRCGAVGRSGVVARLLSVFERTVHAQDGCHGDGSCSSNWTQVTDNSCGANCTGFTFPGTGMDYCSGYYVNGDEGCVGSACDYFCNVSGCTSSNCGGGGGGGGCTENNGSCSQDSDCCSGDCSDGTCQDTEVLRGR